MDNKTVEEYAKELHNAFKKALFTLDYPMEAFNHMFDSLVINDVKALIDSGFDTNEAQLIELLIKRREKFGLICSETNLLYSRTIRIEEYDMALLRTFPFITEWYLKVLSEKWWVDIPQNESEAPEAKSYGKCKHCGCTVTIKQ